MPVLFIIFGQYPDSGQMCSVPLDELGRKNDLIRKIGKLIFQQAPFIGRSNNMSGNQITDHKISANEVNQSSKRIFDDKNTQYYAYDIANVLMLIRSHKPYMYLSKGNVLLHSLTKTAIGKRDFLWTDTYMARCSNRKMLRLKHVQTEKYQDNEILKWRDTQCYIWRYTTWSISIA